LSGPGEGKNCLEGQIEILTAKKNSPAERQAQDKDKCAGPSGQSPTRM
jgi:hypothetical protein